LIFCHIRLARAFRDGFGYPSLGAGGVQRSGDVHASVSGNTFPPHQGFAGIFMDCGARGRGGRRWNIGFMMFLVWLNERLLNFMPATVHPNAARGWMQKNENF